MYAGIHFYCEMPILFQELKNTSNKSLKQHQKAICINLCRSIFYNIFPQNRTTV